MELSTSATVLSRQDKATRVEHTLVFRRYQEERLVALDAEALLVQILGDMITQVHNLFQRPLDDG